MTRLARLAIVTVGLSVAGAILGAVAAGGALATSDLLRGTWASYSYGGAVVAALLGAALGAVFGPACALIFLRRLPLWIALLGPTVATFAGGVVGELWGGLGLITAPAAFFVAVGLLYVAGHRVAKRALADGEQMNLPLPNESDALDLRLRAEHEHASRDAL